MEERNLPEGWVISNLEDFVDVYDNLRKPINADDRQSRMGPYPYYGATGQVGWIDDFLIDGEYVLLGEDGAPFLDPYKPKAYLISGKCWVNNHAHVLQTRQGLGNIKYLLYYLNNVDYRSLVGGTTRLKLNQSDMRQIKMKVAPLPEQERIVYILEEKLTILDEAINTLKKDKEKLKKARASVLKYAVEGKLTEIWRANTPATETAPALLERVLEERRKLWEEEQLSKGRDLKKVTYVEPIQPNIEGLRKLPVGWCWSTVEQLANTIGGVTKGRNLTERETTELPYLRVANVQRGFVDITTMKTIEIPKEEVTKYLLNKGDVLLIEGGDADKLGRAAVWDALIKKCIHQNHVFRARLINTFMPSLWLVYYFNSSYGKEYFLKAAKQTVNLASINLTQVKACPIPLPPLEEQKQIISEVEQRLSVITQAEIAIETNLKRAERTRQSLLEQAFSGQLVPQDPNDEPANVLLERIQEERAKQTEGKKRLPKKNTSQPYVPQWQTIANKNQTTKQQHMAAPETSSEDLDDLLHAQPVSLWD